MSEIDALLSELKRDQERAGLKAASDLANADGGFDEQARLEAEYAAAAKRTKYTTKLQRQIAGAPNRVSVCCTIIEGLLMQLSPQERVLANAAMAQSAAAASSSLLSPDVATMKVSELKNALKARGLDQSGRKADLAARLLATQPSSVSNDSV